MEERKVGERAYVRKVAISMSQALLVTGAFVYPYFYEKLTLEYFTSFSFIKITIFYGLAGLLGGYYLGKSSWNDNEKKFAKMIQEQIDN